ncbi:MAG: flavodoxin [Clostridia bacterium]|nr:flavodoxin [Clostridia bacterium]
MRRFFSTIILAIVFMLTFSAFAFGAESGKTIIMQIDNPEISVDGVNKSIDENGTVPVIISDRTFIPVRALIENIGGNADWDNETKTAVLTYGDDEIKLTVDSNTAYYNNISAELDASPVIVNGRTMLPVRFIAEGFGFAADWDSESRTITISAQLTEASTELTTGVLEESTVVQTNELTDSKVLVAYFSCTGNTEEAAEKIAQAANGDIFKIEAKIPYTDDDLNYNNDNCRANREQNDPDARPEIESIVDNMEGYDTIYIGYPIWWGDCPKIICTFMESYDFTNKTLIPFCTSGGSGISESENTLKSLADANWLSGRRLNSNMAEEEIKEWINELSR